MLDDMISGNWVEARAVIGFYACNSNSEDDIELYAGEGADKSQQIGKFFTLRQQEDRG